MDLFKFVNGEYIKNLDLDVEPILLKKQAFEKALKYIGAEKYIWEEENSNFIEMLGQEDLRKKPEGKLLICRDYTDTINYAPVLAYKFEINALKPASSGRCQDRKNCP